MRFYKKNKFLKSPKIVQIEITNKCPLHCSQCYKKSKPKIMAKTKFKQIIDECSEIGVGSIMINGGEPMTHEDFVEMVQYVSEKDMMNYCFLSGYGVTQKVIDQLDKLRISISISLNGSIEMVNGLSRDGYKYANNAISLLKYSNINWGINWVARHDNISDFNDLIYYAIKNGANHINVIANKINGDKLISPMDYSDYVLLRKYIENYRSKIDIHVESCFSIMNAFMETNMPALYKGCMAGILACFVDIDGNYHPCSHLFYPEKFDSIKEYWSDSLYLKQLRSIDLKTSQFCMECERNGDCRFCRAVSYETSIDFNIGFKRCPVIKR